MGEQPSPRRDQARAPDSDFSRPTPAEKTRSGFQEKIANLFKLQFIGIVLPLLLLFLIAKLSRSRSRSSYPFVVMFHAPIPEVDKSERFARR